MGAAYFDTPVGGAQAPLLCVSPGNTLEVRIVNGVPVQEPTRREGDPDRRGGAGFERCTDALPRPGSCAPKATGYGPAGR